MQQRKKTSWGGVAKWYDTLLSQEGTFQKDVILPGLLRLMELKRGERVLDIACGTGFFSREFYRAGADVIGVDISKELIDIARLEAPRIDFKVTPAEKLGIFKDASFDKAAIILAIQNIQHYQKALVEAGRILKKGGKLFLVMTHPAFRVPKGSSWGFLGHDVQYRRVDHYLSEFEVGVDMHPGQVASEQTITFHRPLQSYVKALAKAGLAISNLEEWTSHKVSDSGPRAKAENVARKEIPLFMFIEATKL
ncbi:MAG: methyltransferase domain-containing protein [Patescibacteria group bacterium]